MNEHDSCTHERALHLATPDRMVVDAPDPAYEKTSPSHDQDIFRGLFTPTSSMVSSVSTTSTEDGSMVQCKIGTFNTAYYWF